MSNKRVFDVDEISQPEECDRLISLLKRHKTTIITKRKRQEMDALVALDSEFTPELKTLSNSIGHDCFTVDGQRYIVEKLIPNVSITLCWLDPIRNMGYPFRIGLDGVFQEDAEKMLWEKMERVVQFARFLVREWKRKT